MKLAFICRLTARWAARFHRRDRNRAQAGTMQSGPPARLRRTPRSLRRWNKDAERVFPSVEEEAAQAAVIIVF
jgi:hypothetical protein